MGFGKIIHDLIEATGDEISKLHFDHGAKTIGARPKAAPMAADSMIGVLRTRSFRRSPPGPR